MIKSQASIQEFLKSRCRTAIRILSYALPDAFLFQSSVSLRKFSLRLKRAAAPSAFQRATDFLFYSLRSMRPAVVDSRSRDGKFYIQLNDPCHYDLLLDVHEPEVVSWLCSELREGMIFVDIGANIGYYTLFASPRVGGAGRVIAIEPDPEVAAILRKNIEANALENVQLVHGAVYRENGFVRLGRARSSSYSSGLYCADVSSWIEVPSYSLESLLQQLEITRVDLVKVDVEGAEVEVLEGMTTILKRDRPKVMLEFHGRREDGDAHPAVQQLKKAGYVIHIISEGHAVGEMAADGVAKFESLD